MIIKARFASTCPNCWNRIAPGDEVEWSKGAKAKHVTCPASESDEGAKADGDAITIYGGSGYGCTGWQAGQVIKAPRGTATTADFLYVLSAKRSYFPEDGMSFGVGDDRGYIYSAKCRPATDEERAPVLEKIENARKRREASKTIEEIVRTIETTGVKPEKTSLTGNKVWDDSTRTMVASVTVWIDASENRISVERYNGRDGDMWAWNNCAMSIVTHLELTPEIQQAMQEAVAILGEK